jgi:hypothetical protein
MVKSPFQNFSDIKRMHPTYRIFWFDVKSAFLIRAGLQKEAFIGSRLLKKITMRAIQLTVGILFFVLSIALGAGLV